MDGEFDRALLDPIEVLKLNQEEADALAGGPFDTPTATRLGIAEILVTFGAGGCDVYLDGDRNHIPARAVPRSRPPELAIPSWSPTSPTAPPEWRR